MREGEALGLQWSDVDFEARTLRVRQHIQRQGGGLLLKPPKPKADQRTLGLSPELIEELRAHRARQRADRLAAGPEWKGEEWNLVFASRVGTPLDPSNVSKRIKTPLVQAGLPAMRFHDLRHAAASLLLAQGEPMSYVKEILGHSQIGLTVNTHGHLAPEVLTGATDKLGAALFRRAE